MKTRLVALTILALSLAAVSGLAADQDDETQPSYWMKKKLQYNEKILEGLVSNDFDQIARNAHSMGALSRVEKWVHANTREYRAQLQVFENANEQLARMARDENIDGAALAYVQLTMSCVQCHKVVRDVKSPAAK